MMPSKKPRQIAAVVMICVIALAADAQAPKKKTKAAPKPLPKPHFDQAFYAGRLVNFRAVPGKDAKHTRLVGPWNLGEKVNPKRNDKRPNLYFVVPGTQHRIDEHPEYDHNEVLSAVPEEESYFDVYWVVVLDPNVKEDFTGEQQIILATQETFVPSEDFNFDQIPSAGFLKSLLNIRDLEGLEKYRRSDGGLPQVAIITAGFSVNATAEEIPQTPAPDSQETTAPKGPSW
jgi:hypothetical protein